MRWATRSGCHIDGPVLWDLARIVHEADLDDERFDAPEAPRLDVRQRPC